MANQIIIDIGAVANDGTGDPLRTAFGYVNNNFSNIWNTGVANANISFSGNRILTTNTNGNLVLAPNGIGKVQSNVDIVPNANNTLSLGSLTNRWNTVYAQYLEVGGEINLGGDLTVNGNLTVEGDTIQLGNIVTDTKTIQLANTAGTANAANGSGITVGANDNIATILYNSTSNVWTTNIGLTATGNIRATGSMFAQDISLGNVFTANGVYGEFGSFRGKENRGINALTAGVSSFTFLGSDVIAQYTGDSNAYTQFNFQNINSGTEASGDYVITADNGNDTTHFINLGMTSSNWDGNQPNSLGNRLGPNDGYLYVQDGDLVIGTSNGTIETWKFGQNGTLTAPGNITTTGNISGGNLTVSSAGNTWTISDQYLTAPGGAYWHSHPEQSTDDFVGSPGSDIRLQSIDANSVVESQINLTDTDIELVVVNGVTKTWRFNESGISEIPGDITPVTAGGATANIGNVSNPWTNAYISGNVNAGNVNLTGTVSSNLVPTGNNVQTLGNNTNRWSNLYLSGNTIYLGDLSLSAGPEGLTSTAGFDLANSTAANIEATGNITANYFLGNIEGLIGNITNLDSLNFAVENISALVGNNGVNIGAGGFNNLVVLPTEVIIQNVPLTVAGNILSTVTGGLNITANTVANGIAQTWNFGTDGDLTVPGNVVSGNSRINLQELGSDAVYITPVTDDTTSLYMDASGIVLNSAVGMTVTANTAGNIIAWSFNDAGAFGLPYGGTLDNDSTNNVELRSTNNISMESAGVVNVYTENGNYQWQFGNDGALTFPDSANIVNGGFNGTASSTVSLNAFSPDGNTVSFQAQGNTSNAVIQTYANATATTYNWTFDNAGVLTAPGNIITTGNVSGNTAGYAIGYRDIPQVSFTGNATIATTDAGKHFYSTQSSNFTLTIANNASQGFQVGAAITVVNQGTGTITIAQDSGVTLYLAGNATPGNRSVSTFGMATIMKVATDTWFINGTGVS